MADFVFRNQTVEPFFGYDGMAYSGYGDISVVPDGVDRYIWFYQVPVNADSIQLAEEIESYSGQLDLVLSGIDEHKTFVIFSLVNLFPLRLTGDETAVEAAIAAFNDHASRLAMSRANVKWVDFGEFVSRYDAEKLMDWKYYFMSQTMLNPKLAHDFKAWWERIDCELSLQRKKCLVLDLDNTLWSGVLGEDGVDGIKLGGDYPGKAFAAWQQALLQLSRNGVILAVCSKNNEDDVVEAWDKNSAMVLKREHFSAVRINWQDKASNLQALAQDLNIGLDSMVFVDDNPA
jgi:HAD superfamily phosphatase (TIGR01681 family)